MRVKVILFGILKVWAKSDEVDCDLERAGATVDDLFTYMAERAGLSRERLAQVAAAVGDELVPRCHALRDGDLVMLLPPVSGG